MTMIPNVLIRPLHFVGLRAFVRHVTGAEVLRKRSIRVEFMEGSSGCITVHTCANQITLPRGVFMDEEDSYKLFVSAMEAVVACDELSYNMV